MRALTAYLVIAGFWTWGGLWWVLIFDKAPLLPNLGAYFRVTCVAAACFASAYAMHRRSKFAVPLIFAIPIAQWLVFARVDPSRFSLTDNAVDFAYLRRLPPMLEIDIIFYFLLACYACWLWKRGKLI